jgi:hypothetical protein
MSKIPVLKSGYPKSAGRRHYACRHSLSTIEDYRALTLENELIRVTFLLDKGTDIIEFLYKPRDVDFLWRSRNGLRSMRSYQPMSAAWSSTGGKMRFEGSRPTMWYRSTHCRCRAGAPVKYLARNTSFHIV